MHKFYIQQHLFYPGTAKLILKSVREFKYCMLLKKNAEISTYLKQFKATINKII